MNNLIVSLQIVRPKDARTALGLWIRCARQRAEWTQPMLAAKSGVPVATLSRLEREGQGALDAVARVLHALGELDGLHVFVQERIRLASLPGDLAELDAAPRERRRVRPRRRAAKGGDR